MSHDSVDKLVKMANQIGKFFVAQKHPEGVVSMTEHLRKFWDPRMRNAIIAHVEHGGAGLDPIAIEAVKRLGHRAGAAASESRPGEHSVEG
ncbi:MAG: formate dehydrogenase subunit delta [Methylocystis sp.]